MAFGVIVAIISLSDILTWVPAEAALKSVSWIIPAAFPALNEPKPVPNRVTFK